MNINRISSAIQSGASTVLGGFSKSNPMDALKNAFNTVIRLSHKPSTLST